MTTTAATHEHQSEKKRLACPGFNGANPLHFLASLGTFRLLCLHDPEARMRWLSGETWHPEYLTSLDEEAFCNTLAGDFGWDPSVDPATEENAASTKGSGAKRGKGTGGGKKNKGDNDDGEQETATEDGGAGAQTMSPRMKKLATLFPVAFSGQVIKRPVAEFRELALQACNAGEAWSGALPLQDELVAAFASDGVVRKEKNENENKNKEEKEGAKNKKNKENKAEIFQVLESPLSFSNRSGSQFLLQHWAELACGATGNCLKKFFFEGEFEPVACPSLNWDPSDLRSHAFMANDPQDVPKRTNVAANALAFVGFCFYPVSPVRDKILLGALHEETNEFFWPIWSVFCCIEVVRSLLCQGKKEYFKRADFVYVSKRIFNDHQRRFFSPSRPAQPGK